MLAERFRRWFDYEINVHSRVMAALESVPVANRSGEEFLRAVSIFAHIVAARQVWLFRLGLAPAPEGSLFPENPELQTVMANWMEVLRLWKRYLYDLTDKDITKTFEYQALDGGRFRNTIEEVLTQLFGHSSYHRGQIAMLVKSAGGTPAITDFIYLCRVAI
jgi:uncharacterized damage-inducible protein DinB